MCVWDDLVDVPVAIPMRPPSSEITRKRDVRDSYDQEEEMDIGFGSGGHRQGSGDLLLMSPTSELPNPHRFELTREDSSGRIPQLGDDEDIAGPSSPIAIQGLDFAESQARQAKNNLSNSVNLPIRPSVKGKARFSFDFPPTRVPIGKRQRSMSTRTAKKADMFYEGDDLEGDLGYSAATDMDGLHRKVIVERLEAVKSKNPVFTWC